MRQLAATCAHRVLQIQPRVAAVLLGKKTHPKWSQFAAVDATLFCYFHGYGISLLGARTTELPHSCWSYIQFLVVYHWFIHFFRWTLPILASSRGFALCSLRPGFVERWRWGDGRWSSQKRWEFKTKRTSAWGCFMNFVSHFSWRLHISHHSYLLFEGVCKLSPAGRESYRWIYVSHVPKIGISHKKNDIFIPFCPQISHPGSFFPSQVPVAAASVALGVLVRPRDWASAAYVHLAATATSRHQDPPGRSMVYVRGDIDRYSWYPLKVLFFFVKWTFHFKIRKFPLKKWPPSFRNFRLVAWMKITTHIHGQSAMTALHRAPLQSLPVALLQNVLVLASQPSTTQVNLSHANKPTMNHSANPRFLFDMFSLNNDVQKNRFKHVTKDT